MESYYEKLYASNIMENSKEIEQSVFNPDELDYIFFSVIYMLYSV